MEFVIAYSKTKRKFTCPFEICGRKEDLINLAEQILAEADSNFSYGWIKIEENMDLAHTAPMEWD